MSSVTPETSQFLIFSLANYLFAIPSHQTVKVVPMPTPAEGDLSNIGLVQLAQYSIQLLNLPKLIELTHKLSANKTPTATKHFPFLLVLQDAEQNAEQDAEQNAEQNAAQNAEKSLFGIALTHPPDLLEVPTLALQSVPQHQRKSGTLQWVSHVVTSTKEAKRRVVLVLDLSMMF